MNLEMKRKRKGNPLVIEGEILRQILIRIENSKKDSKKDSNLDSD